MEITDDKTGATWLAMHHYTYTLKHGEVFIQRGSSRNEFMSIKEYAQETKNIRSYLEKSWESQLKRGRKEPSVGKEKYIHRNTPYVRYNIKDNPDYITAALKNMLSRERGFE